MKTSTIAMFLVAGTVLSGLLGIIGPQAIQNAFAQSASSSGASTDLGSSSTSSSGNFFTGGSSSSSGAGGAADSDGEGFTPSTSARASR